eukprot:TRINITY_DN70046_c0_g1_i1.p1 TRINITY_DN70046_c0_g1~~TRINITY_DN70046_c0_g1_i1.p1  ORF type:complete len:248 (-),score=51.81 TRINITY_DN70046_c0_g1_i1:684-1343(-)
MSSKKVGAAIAAGGVAGAAAAPAIAVASVQAMGFGAGGIVAGTAAAGMMSSAAVANGGGIAAGCLVAQLQSVGAAGLGVGTSAGIATGGAALGMVVVGGTVAAAVALQARLERCRQRRAAEQQSEAPVAGSWTVATEENFGELKYYPFNGEGPAKNFIADLLVPFVLYNDTGREITSWGLNPWALTWIRTAASQSSDGEWKVVTEDSEEGIGNVKFYLV